MLAYGGWEVLEHALTPGDVVMFVTYLDRLLDPIQELSRLANTLQQDLASVARALRLQRPHTGEPRGAPLGPGPGHVEFRNVQFSYVPDREVLHGVSFVVAAGRVTALIGPSGSGKTTAVDLLLRLFEPDGGDIFIDGQPLRTVDPSALRAEISVVSADGALFRSTIAENIRYKRPEASDTEVLDAVRAAGLEPALARLPDLVVRPSHDLGEIAARCLSGRRSRGLRDWLSHNVVRYLGRGRPIEADLLSYLFFDRCYTERLIDLGRRDAEHAADAIARFLSDPIPGPIHVGRG